MTANNLRSILEELTNLIGLDQPVYIRRVDFKQQIASVSFNKRIIRLNKHLDYRQDLELLRYIILHELTHLKLKHPYHNEIFYQTISQYLPRPTSWYDKKLAEKYSLTKTVLI